MEQGMYTLWMLWNNKNNRLHSMTCRNATSMRSLIAKMVKEYKEAVSSLVSNKYLIREVWQPPSRDYMKVNVDVAYCKTTGWPI